MKKELTINTLAVGNLKQHKKQYTVMIIGIVLAMVFSNSVIFMISAMSNSTAELKNERFGKQSVILANVTENDIEKAKENKVLGKSGYAHILGTLIGANEDFYGEAKLAYLDDTAYELANLNLIEGRMPENENEIAVEKMVLSKIGTDAKIGDDITFDLKPQNGKNVSDEKRPVTYKLVGVLTNKYNYISECIGQIEDEYVPSAFISKNTNVGFDVKEKLVCYANFYDNKETKSGEENFRNYLSTIGFDVAKENCFIASKDDVYHLGDDARNIESKITFTIFLIAVLMAASCMVIINSFNSNLEERKKQIGMFRAIGATKRQIRKIFAREALIISLISAPVSCLISLIVVKTILKLMGDGFVFKLDLWVILVSLFFCIVCVMISAVIPLISASRITPIQAIRNIENMRTLHKKRIKSKKCFNVPKLIANRSFTFGKGKQIAVIVILIIVIVGSGYTLSLVSYSSNYSLSSYDYSLDLFHDNSPANVNFKSFYSNNFTEYDRRFIAKNQYIGESNGMKRVNAQMIVPLGDSEYRKYLSPLYSRNYGKYPDDQMINKTNYKEVFFTQRDESPNNKKLQELFDGSEFINLNMYSYDAEFLESLKKYVYDGKINVNKINSGEEIILMAPQKIGKNHAYLDGEYRGLCPTYDDDVDKEDCVFKADSDFHAGDEIEIAVITADTPAKKGSYKEMNDSGIPDDVVVTRKKVKIGAIINRDAINSADGLWASYGCSVIISTSAMNSFVPNLKYERLFFNLNTACTDEIEKSVMEDINEVMSNYGGDGRADSNYGYAQEQREDMNRLFIAMISVFILLFAISISIINNTLTANIRNSKTKIGTLRAVGADEKSLVKTYIYQLMSMLLWGSGLGLGGFFISYYVSYLIHLANNAKLGRDYEWQMICNPTAAVIFIILAFVICSLNLWLKIRKEMKNSIVENIREL